MDTQLGSASGQSGLWWILIERHSLKHTYLERFSLNQRLCEMMYNLKRLTTGLDNKKNRFNYQRYGRVTEQNWLILQIQTHRLNSVELKREQPQQSTTSNHVLNPPISSQSSPDDQNVELVRLEWISSEQHEEGNLLRLIKIRYCYISHSETKCFSWDRLEIRLPCLNIDNYDLFFSDKHLCFK